MGVLTHLALTLGVTAALGSALAWGRLAWSVRRDYRRHRFDLDHPASNEPSEWPAVSVIVPARNEAANIGPCLDALLDVDYPGLRIFVVDDGSTDGTGAVARARSDERSSYKVLRTEGPPSGWMGKQAACMHGAAAAGGAWLLFVDADARVAPRALRRSIAHCVARKLSLFSLSPRQTCLGFWEPIVQSVIYRFLNLRYRYAEVNDDASPRAAAHGAFLLVERRAFEAVGGFTPARYTAIDDAVLAETIKRAGFPVGFAPTLDLVSVRMYAGMRALWDGWTKTAFAFLDQRPSLLLRYSFLMTLTHIVPAFLFAAALTWSALTGAGPMWRDAAIPVAAFLLVGSLACDLMLRRLEGFAAWPVLFLPLGALVWLAIFWRSAARRWRGKPAVWRGRNYPPSPASKG